ncbi:protein FAM84A [Arapaima gigas]
MASAPGRLRWGTEMIGSSFGAGFPSYLTAREAAQRLELEPPRRRTRGGGEHVWSAGGSEHPPGTHAAPRAGAAPPSLMGNHLDRITHLSYSELPTGDPSGVEKDELRVGVAYFFSDEEEELDERPPADPYAEQSPPQEGGPALPDELQYSAFCRHECIFSKLRENQDLHVYPARALLAACRPGDLLELVAGDEPPHWAVYERDGQVIHLYGGEIRRDGLLEVSDGRMGRVANGRYRYRALPPDLVVQNARGHLGLRAPDVCWTNSESFAAWCRFGKREFKAGAEARAPGQRYFLKVHLSASDVHTLAFHSLEELIRERRKVDASGILKELSLVGGKQ